MKLLCKCHGVSGSCSVKICWRTVPSFRDVGAFLKDKFDGASRMKFVKKTTKKGKLKPWRKMFKRPSRKDLVYLDESPDYCRYNPETGILGTSGRECNRTSRAIDSCNLLCCGRGYRTILKKVKEDCNCKFFWCCRVECQQCVRIVEKHYCK